MLHRTLQPLGESILPLLVFLGTLTTSVFAQDAIEREDQEHLMDRYELLNELLLEDEEFLTLPDDVFIEDESLAGHKDGLLPEDEAFFLLPDDTFVEEWRPLQAHPDSPIKGLNVKSYLLSNGEKGYVHTGESIPPDSKPAGLKLRVDLDNGTYNARRPTTQERELIHQILRESAPEDTVVTHP